MADPVIHVEGLSKRYHIGVRRQHDTLRDKIMAVATSPIRSLRSFGRSSDREEDVVWALKDASFDVEAGEVVGIIGRNGAGKSTLLKILTRITDPTSGRAELRGRVGSLLEVGTGFHSELTGRENIFLSGAILGMTRGEIKSQLDAIIDFSGVEKFIDTPVKRYSSGMHVRLGFAIAAHLQPEILLVDEVLAVGDAEFQKKCLGKMGDVAKGGRTILFVSHNMAAVQRLCPRAILFSEGHLEQDGTADDVIASYAHEDASGDGEEGQRDFDAASAPGDDAVRIRQIRLAADDGEPRGTFRMDECFSVEIVYDVLKAIGNFHFYAKVYTTDGVLAFCSADWDGGEVAALERSPGQYKAALLIPAHLLNVGAYLFSLDGLIPSVRYLFQEPNIITWKINTRGGAGGTESINRRGIVRPLLKWDESHE
jgi:lipopolysaccharide transport system ATP-binding protein